MDVDDQPPPKVEDDPAPPADEESEASEESEVSRRGRRRKRGRGGDSDEDEVYGEDSDEAEEEEESSSEEEEVYSEEEEDEEDEEEEEEFDEEEEEWDERSKSFKKRTQIYRGSPNRGPPRFSMPHTSYGAAPYMMPPPGFRPMMMMRPGMPPMPPGMMPMPPGMMPPPGMPPGMFPMLPPYFIPPGGRPVLPRPPPPPAAPTQSSEEAKKAEGAEEAGNEKGEESQESVKSEAPVEGEGTKKIQEFAKTMIASLAELNPNGEQKQTIVLPANPEAMEDKRAKLTEELKQQMQELMMQDPAAVQEALKSVTGKEVPAAALPPPIRPPPHQMNPYYYYHMMAMMRPPPPGAMPYPHMYPPYHMPRPPGRPPLTPNAPMAKRPRGRPPKARSLAEAEGLDYYTPSSSRNATPGTSDRPKRQAATQASEKLRSTSKSVQRLEDAKFEEELEEADAEARSAGPKTPKTPSATPGKRGRGRPRKNPVVVDNGDGTFLTKEENFSRNRYREEADSEDDADADYDVVIIDGEEVMRPKVDRILAHRVAEDGDGDEFLVKYRNQAYVHCDWLSRKEMLEMPKGSLRISRFLNKLAANPLLQQQQQDEDPINPEWMEIERVVWGWKHPPPGEPDAPATQESFLVKWCGLPWEEATFETKDFLQEEMEEGPEKLQEYLDEQAGREAKAAQPVLPPQARLTPNDWRPMTESPLFKNDNTLRSYQLEGVNWLVHCWTHRQSCIIADEMVKESPA